MSLFYKGVGMYGQFSALLERYTLPFYYTIPKGHATKAQPVWGPCDVKTYIQLSKCNYWGCGFLVKMGNGAIGLIKNL